MKYSVLTVDDSLSIRHMVRFTLEKENYEVIEAADGVQALDSLRTREPDLIITDINMPRLNGIQLIERIKQNPRLRYLPIIVLTTESQRNLKDLAKAAGATGWIVKPFKPEQLVRVVKRFTPSYVAEAS